MFENSLWLILGAVGGLLWANLDYAGYSQMLHFKVLVNSLLGRAGDGGRVIDLHFLVNDVLMALFFGLAGREVWHAVLPGGPMSRPRRAIVPLACAMGGMIGPACIYVLGAWAIGRLDELGRGWAVPCATDIAFSYMVARTLFGPRHPVIPFLLLLAIVDDALGMLIVAVFYPQGPVQLVWLLLSASAVIVGVGFRLLRVHSFWWYLLVPGPLSWLGFALAGLHPALGLLPVVPTIPHAHIHRRHTGWDVLRLADSRNEMEYWLARPVEVVLGVFGLMNAGVLIGKGDAVTLLVLTGLLVGKPIGIFLSGLASVRLAGLELAKGVGLRELLVAGCTAGIGFTVSLFMATVAFEPGLTQDSAKLGALVSFVAAIIAWALAKALGVGRVPADP